MHQIVYNKIDLWINWLNMNSFQWKQYIFHDNDLICDVVCVYWFWAW